MTDEEVKALLVEADLNKDGNLDYSEVLISKHFKLLIVNFSCS